MSDSSNQTGFEKTRQPLITAGRIIGALVFIVVCTGGYFIYNSLAKKDATYLSMPVSKGAILDKVQATGTVMPLHEVDLYFKQQGTLKLLNVRSGDEVKAGQVLAVQDNSQLQAELEQARSNLLLAEYKLQQSQLDLEKIKETAERQDALYQAGALARSDWEQAERDFAAAQITAKSDQASLQSARAKVVIAENELNNAELTAPFSGVAAQVNGEVGQETGNSSSPMFHLISNDLKVEVMVNEVDIGRVKLNQDVLFNVSSYPNRPFNGKVSRISPQATTTNNVQLYEVDIATRGLSDQLRAGMSVTANIIIKQKPDVTIVPNIAFSYASTYLSAQRTTARQPDSNSDAGQSRSPVSAGNNRPGSVYSGRVNNDSSGVKTDRQVVVLEQGQPALKQIKAGISDNQNTEVLSGLNPGDRVVIGTDTPTGSASTSSGNGQGAGGQRPGGGFHDIDGD